VGNGIFGCASQAEFEAGQAAGTTLRSIDSIFGHTLDVLQPGLVIIFIVDDLQPERGGISGKFVSALDIFFEWNDVGIAEEHTGLQAFCYQPFKDGRGAGGAAAMQEDATLLQIATLRNLRLECTSLEMLHNAQYYFL
jgi:hypothetical protein